MRARTGVAEMLARGVRAVGARRGLVATLFLLQLGVSLIFVFIAQRTFTGAYAQRPLFGRGVAGDDAALVLALVPQGPALRALLWAGVGLAGAYALLSLYLGAGLLGAFAGRPFAATANARLGAFVRLFLVALVPLAIAGAVLVAGVWRLGPQLEDLRDLPLLTGRTLLGAAPGLALLVWTGCAIDYARADLVVRGGGATRALLRALGWVVTRRAPLAHYLIYGVFWIAVSALFVAGTVGQAFAGVLGALLLLALRQLVAALRFSARAVASAGQLHYLQLDVLEMGELVESPEARRDVVEREPAQPVEREVLDAE